MGSDIGWGNASGNFKKLRNQEQIYLPLSMLWETVKPLLHKTKNFR